MGINIGIMEMEAPGARCRELRSDIVKVHLADPSGFEDGAVYEELVPLEKAQSLFPDWDAFMKRNRLNEDVDAVYLSKIKKDEDLAALKPLAERRYTGWIEMSGLPGDARRKAEEASAEAVTAWDQLEFDEMNEMCSSCPLSWDKGRGCIGAFGPDNSLLPGIAGRHGCPIVASVPEAVETRRVFTSADAEELLRETAVLKDALPEEGKMMVRRYSGPVERLEAVARISKDQGCGFYFFRPRLTLRPWYTAPWGPSSLGARRTRASVMLATSVLTPFMPTLSSS